MDDLRADRREISNSDQVHPENASSQGSKKLIKENPATTVEDSVTQDIVPDNTTGYTKSEMDMPVQDNKHESPSRTS